MVQVAIDNAALNAHGTGFLDEIIDILDAANTITVTNQVAHAGDQNGLGQVTMNFYLGLEEQTVGAFSVQHTSGTTFSFSPVFISYVALKQVVETGTKFDIAQAFAGENWELDLSGSDHEMWNVGGSGGSDVFKFGGGGDHYYLDGGKDEVSLGGGDDWIAASNEYGYAGIGLAKINGGAGTDSLNMHAMFEEGQTVDLAGTTTFEGSKYRFKSVENVYGTQFSDDIRGTSGENTLVGGTGDDVIYGRGGEDALSGEGGLDTYLYRSIADSRVGRNQDFIADFAPGQDEFDFAALHPDTRNDKLIFIGSDKFHGREGELRFKMFDEAGDSNDRTLVEIDMDGDRKADFRVTITDPVILEKTDFVL